MRIKVWEMVDTNNDMKWYELYDRPNDYQNGIYNNGYDEVTLPEGFEIGESESGKLYIYKNGLRTTFTGAKQVTCFIRQC